MSDDYSDIKNGGNETPSIDDGGDSTGTSSPLSLPSLDQRKLALLVGLAVVVTVAIWWVRQNGGTSAVTESIEEYDLDAEEYVEDEQRDGEIHVPEGGDPLDKDAAVYDGLVEAGVMQGGEDE